MHATFYSRDPENDTAIEPSFLEAIARPLSLLPGENPREFEAIRDSIIQEIGPRSGIEWLWTFDLVELSWDVQRYRTLRQKVLETYRAQAVERMLRPLDGAAVPSGSQDIAHRQTKCNAAKWRGDSKAALEIENRLASHGFDATSIDMEVIIQAREIFIMFDSLMHSAQTRRILLLREIEERRLSAKRGRRLKRVTLGRGKYFPR
jgi:hypothetical protein